MSLINQTYKLKNGLSIIVREADTEDAEALLRLKKGYIKNTTSIPLYEYEYRNTVDDEAELINRYKQQKNSLLLVAEHNNELIGNIDLTGNQREKIFHTAALGMGIANNWQNLGIGTCLMDMLLKIATKHLPVNIIWLEVYSSNISGIKLYDKFGFEECGTIKNFFKEKHIADKITMVKYIQNHV
ncbi:hypothetical protein GCM10007424_01880 [Flavobacterium suaedae]|uniref:N-acetyltransferase domain-containing protein n=1 Tax=Flavobacterium suaedae TaxID=1767027 RepID=A0ABQ1JD66_9FLAO|nr:GNAT family N-acetyltransferase [Flavobacterium suaedae]GGB65581.1 hypothetical protein GCM10007424_01880 [Flavobacterium suaedae]